MYSAGPLRSEFGAGIQSYTNITSGGDLDFLRSGATVSGDIRTAGTLLKQNNVTIQGSVSLGATIAEEKIEWQITWPTLGLQSINREPDTPNVSITPGAYDHITLKSRSTVTLRTGTYLVSSLTTEPQAHLQIDTSQGPVYIYVRNELRLRSRLEYQQSTHEQVVMGYWGSQPALFEEALEAAVLAPNAAIELRRPNSQKPHKGAFFGKEVHVFSDATVRHVPLDLAFLCALPGPSDVAIPDASAKEGNFICPENYWATQEYASASCFTGSAAGDSFRISNLSTTTFTMLFAQGGNDIVVNRQPGVTVFAGAGNDLLCGLADGQTVLFGGEGDDRIVATGKFVEIVPGPGKDTVTIADGDATIRVMHACELVSGESFKLKGGTARIFSPLEREEMEALGVHIDAAIKVEVVNPLACDSLCSGAPLCAGDEECVDEADGGAHCIQKNPIFEGVIPEEERYLDLPSPLRDWLIEYIKEIEQGSQVAVAPDRLRSYSGSLEGVLVRSISQGLTQHRAAEVFALGSLYTPSALLALRDIAVAHAPAGVGDGHYEDGGDWYAGQIQAIRWIHAAARALSVGETHVDSLLLVVRDGDAFTTEVAVNALLELDPSLGMRERIADIIPTQKAYILDLQFE